MANLEQLNFAFDDDEDLDDVIDLDSIPTDSFGGFEEPPQPGRGYRFRLPMGMADLWQKHQVQDKATGRITDELRLAQSATEAFITVTITHSPTGEGVGSTCRLRASTQKFTRGEQQIIGLSYLARAVGLTGRATKRALVEAISAASGMEIVGDVTWSASCNPQREARDAEGNKMGVNGCGARFDLRSYVRKDGSTVSRIPQTEDGKWASTFVCPDCQASVRAFYDIRNLRKA